MTFHQQTTAQKTLWSPNLVQLFKKKKNLSSGLNVAAAKNQKRFTKERQQQGNFNGVGGSGTFRCFWVNFRAKWDDLGMKRASLGLKKVVFGA
jgi:hypothetical protein